MANVIGMRTNPRPFEFVSGFRVKIEDGLDKYAAFAESVSDDLTREIGSGTLQLHGATGANAGIVRVRKGSLHPATLVDGSSAGAEPEVIIEINLSPKCGSGCKVKDAVTGQSGANSTEATAYTFLASRFAPQAGRIGFILRNAQGEALAWGPNGKRVTAPAPVEATQDNPFADFGKAPAAPPRKPAASATSTSVNPFANLCKAPAAPVSKPAGPSPSAPVNRFADFCKAPARPGPR